MDSERPLPALDLPLVSTFTTSDLLHVRILRSPVAKGRIKSIHIPHLPRGYRSIMIDDIPGSKTITVFGTEIPVLARERVSYRGEPIALLAGPDPARLQEAIELAHISLEEEEPDFTFSQFNSDRIAARCEYSHGDVELAFSIAQSMAEHEYHSAALYHAAQEPQGAVVWFDYDKLTIRCASQWPYLVRSQVAAVLDVKESEIVIEAADPGNHLDSRLWYPALLAAQAALAAVICGRPTRLILDRREDFLYTTLRAPVFSSYRSSCDKNGKLNAIDARIIINCGAYGVLAEEMAKRALAAASGAYSADNLRIQCYAVQSNLVPLGPFAGLVMPQILFAAERLIDDCARLADIEPVQMRRLNLLEKAAELGLVKRKKNIPFDELVESVCGISDFNRKHASFELVRKRHSDPAGQPGRGIGLAFGYQTPGGFITGSGTAASTVEVELTKEAELIIRSSSIPGTAGTVHIWKQIAADIIGQEPETIHFEPLRTGSLPDAGPSSHSGTITIISKLIEEACRAISQRRFREGLPIKVKKTMRPKNPVPGGPVDGCAWGAAVVELSINSYSGEPEVHGVWLSVKAGRILSIEKARNTLITNTALALSQSLYEHIPLEDGQIPEDANRYYHLARANQIPPIQVLLADSEDKAAIAGVGDLPFCLVAPALANALSQARDTPWQTDFASGMPGGGYW
ncbi:MAG: molybdopterin-dependent oxidoreductase [Spirochaetes bacterium]|nr:molybdopterin-dependent oxidoreductase [Spirochaetota bacterium]